MARNHGERFFGGESQTDCVVIGREKESVCEKMGLEIYVLKFWFARGFYILCCQYFKPSTSFLFGIMETTANVLAVFSCLNIVCFLLVLSA